MPISSTTNISAPPETVWNLISDVRHWPDLLPVTVTSVTPVDPARPEEVGAQYVMEQPRIPRATLELTEWAPPQRFTWRSRTMGVTSTASHVVEAVAGGGSRASLSIEWTGPLAALVRLAYGKLTQRYLDIEGGNLKERAEAS
ncbi:MAG: SRPBCC family protein [Lapillicoccus sp.]